jgi:hypothetical protein
MYILEVKRRTVFEPLRRREHKEKNVLNREDAKQYQGHEETLWSLRDLCILRDFAVQRVFIQTAHTSKCSSACFCHCEQGEAIS